MRRVQLSEKFECEFRVAADRAGFMTALEEFCPSIILCDHSLPQFDSKEALAIARRNFPDIPFIMVTGTISEEYAIEMMKNGVDDYILKDRMTRLPSAMMTSAQKRKADQEKKMLEREREFDRNNLKALINNTDDPMWSVNRSFNLIVANGAFDRMVQALTGQTVEKGKSVFPAGLNPVRLDTFRAYYERAFAGERFTVTEYSDLAGGRWSEISFYPIHTGAIISGAACFSRDITQRKKDEREIAEYKNAIDQTSIVSITDEKGDIKYVNENFCKISGYAESELLGRDHRIVNSGYHPCNYIESLWSTIAGGKTWAGELRNKAKDGALYWVDVTIIPLMDHNRNPVQYLTIGADITKRKSMEQEILSQKIQEQRRTARAIAKARDMERNYLGQELHDNVNQLLAATKMMLSVAQVDPDSRDELLVSSQKNIGNAIEENRKIARGLVVPDFETVPFKKQLALLTDDMLKNAGIEVILDFSLFREELLDDEQKLAIYRAAQEQFTNIIKHAGAGLVQLTLTTTENTLRLAIRDNGNGQSAGLKTAGIGLRNIRGRIALFNGTVTVQSKKGQGFTLDIAIPLAPDGR